MHTIAIPNAPQALARTALGSLIFSLAIALPACGGDANRPASEFPDAAASEASPDIRGSWTSDCLEQPGGTQFAKLDFEIEASTWKLDYELFADASCTTELVTVAIAGPYEIEAATTRDDGAHDARFGFTAKTITPHVSGISDALTSMSCGSGPWQVGEAQSVLEEGCAGFGQYPLSDCAADYDLVSLEGGDLRFGARPADNNMCTPEKRPAALADFALTRVE